MSNDSGTDHVTATTTTAAAHETRSGDSRRARRFRGIADRIAMFYGLLLALVLAVVFGLVTTTSYHIAREQNRKDLEVGARVFHRQLETRDAQLTQAATILAADFGFRAAITSDDRPTIQSALFNQRRRMGADVMLLATPDGALVGDPIPRGNPHSPALDALLRDAATHDTAVGTVEFGDGAYQIVVVPIRAPEPIAQVLVGFRIDDALANDLRALTGLHVSFVSNHGGRWAVLGSTQGPVILDALRNTGPRLVRPVLGEASSLSVAGYDSLSTALADDSNGAVLAVLQLSTADALAQFGLLRNALILFALASLAMAAIGSVLVAKKIAGPINRLAAHARRIRDGDYSSTDDDDAPNEIGTLASTLNHMCEAVAARESDIRRLAFEDPLTALPNRALFNERIQQLAADHRHTGSAFAVLMLDLDRFTFINDTLGHDAGDEVIRLVASRLRGILRDSDTIARIGGDEFAILLPGATAERVDVVVARVHQALDAPVLLADQPVDLGCCIGVVRCPEHGTDAGGLLRCADIAMHAAKRAGIPVAAYDPSHDTTRRELLNLLGELRSAADRSEFRLQFQPKIHLPTNSVVGVEALVRWQHSERGMVPPSEFIPFAEQTGAIRLVTRWVIGAAIAQCRAWADAGMRLKVSLNVSTRDLLDPQLPEIIRGALNKWDVAPRLIGVEITESALMEDPRLALATVMQLHEMGLGISIDDYGTGYSSLAYIKNLPVSEIKIDRAFVSHMNKTAADLAIVRSTIELGHNLGVAVVAEGVETAEEMDLLRRLACDQVQGYHVSRPLSAVDFSSWMRTCNWGAAVTSQSIRRMA